MGPMLEECEIRKDLSTVMYPTVHFGFILPQVAVANSLSLMNTRDRRIISMIKVKETPSYEFSQLDLYVFYHYI